MSKKEKVQAIKELATEDKAKLLSADEMKFLDDRGYNISIFLNSHSAITIYSDETAEAQKILRAIAAKLNRKIISFKGE